MPEFNSLGSRLAYARSARGLRQTDVARHLGIRHSIQVSKWENDEHAPNAKTLAKLADLYQVGVAWLVNGSDYPPDNKTVSRGTVREGTAAAYGLPPAVAQMARDFDRDLSRLGASNYELDYLESIIRSPETSRLLILHEDGRPRTDSETEAEASALLEVLRLWVIGRLERRPIIEAIKPKDLPAEVARRRSELDAEDKKRKTR